MATWPTPTLTVEPRPGPAPLWDHAIDVHLQAERPACHRPRRLPEFAITPGADGPPPGRPHLVPGRRLPSAPSSEALEAL